MKPIFQQEAAELAEHFFSASSAISCSIPLPMMSGENFNPHVSTSVAPKEYLEKMLAERFENFTFSPAGAAVYQLGPFGTAAKKLMDWDFK